MSAGEMETASEHFDEGEEETVVLEGEAVLVQPGDTYGGIASQAEQMEEVEVDVLEVVPVDEEYTEVERRTA